MNQSPACGRLEDNLCFAIYAANHAFTAAYKPLLEPLGLTYPQYLVLLILWEREGRTVKEIGARMHLDSGTLTPLLKRMEANGLLQRERDAEDERQVRIRLTEKGTALQGAVAGVRAQLACTLDDTEQAIGALRDALTTLTGRLRGAGNTP
ncbi:MAG TPA: MarR family transcriptional regulator [Roseomonas sp.]|nr:MarR family transcriptional regulator [Roseomonas sp.]